MRKILLAAIVVGSFLFVGAGAALATIISYTYSDTLVKDLYMNADNTSLDDFGYTYYLSAPLIGTHPAPSPSYVPGTDTFISAGLDLYFSDDEQTDGNDRVKIGIDVSGTSGVNTLIPNSSSNWLYSPIITSAFSTDGILTYNIHAQVGDFIFNRSVFTATWEYDNGIVIIDPPGDIDPPIGAAVVPEPATMLLLGTGLVGLAGAVRRKKKLV